MEIDDIEELMHMDQNDKALVPIVVKYIKRFEDADPFASLAYEILKGHFSYNVNEVAAYILKYVAYDINRFNAQHKIERLINKGVEPLIETILER